MSMYSDILEDVRKNGSILESPDKLYRTDDAAIFAGFANTTTEFNVKSKDPEKWLLPSESWVRVDFSLTNDTDTAAIGATEFVTMISGGLHLFEQARLLIDDNQIELVQKPGYCHVVDHLLTTALDYAQTIAKNEWLYIDAGGITVGAYTDGDNTPHISTVLQTEADGTDVNEYYGLADPIRYAGDINTGTVFSIGGRNPKYNDGFFARWNRTRGGRVVELAIPAGNIFGFFSDIRCAFRGVQFELEFTKNINYTEIMHGMGACIVDGGALVPKAAAAVAHTLIRRIEWIVPTVVPAAIELEKVQRQLESGIKARKVFGSSTCYVNNKTYGVAASNPVDLDWRIQTTGKKITRVVIAFQRGPQFKNSGATVEQNDPNYNATTATHRNGGVFTYFDDINAVELRFGSTILPKERYQRMSFDLANANGATFMRNYVDFANANGGWLNDNGVLIGVEEFRNLFPCFVFDLTDLDLTGSGVTSEDLRVLATFISPAGSADTDSYRALAIVSYEYPLDFVGVSGRLAIEIP